MAEKLSRDELISLVNRIMNAEGTEKEVDQMVILLQRNVPHPEVSNLIFHAEREMSAEEIVDTALAYKPIQL